MTIKCTRNLDEICYPFIHETAFLCDYEVLTDELSTLIGMALSSMPDAMSDVRVDLEQLQPLSFHANGSIRGRMALKEEDLDWLKARLNYYKHEVAERTEGFILPRGGLAVAQLHQARSVSKKAIRALVRVEAEGTPVGDILPRFFNICCNFFFVLTQVVNQRLGVFEPEFVSLSYGKSIA